MTPDQRKQAFHNATMLLEKAFPKRDSTVAQLYQTWDSCATYLPHVISLKNFFGEEKALDGDDFVPLQAYCDLNNRCQRYLLELSEYEELEDLIQANTVAMDSLLPVEQQQPIAGLRASLASHRGQLLCRTGRPEEGVKWLEKSYELRSSHDSEPFDPRESAWAADNLATGLATLNKFEEAMVWFNRARDHYRVWSEQQSGPSKGLPAVTLLRSMGTALIWCGRAEEARRLLDQALEQIGTTEPYNWAVAAYTHFGLGTVDRREGRYDAAEEHFMTAQNLWQKGQRVPDHPFNAACMYRLGCVALDGGKVQAAM